MVKCIKKTTMSYIKKTSGCIFFTTCGVVAPSVHLHEMFCHRIAEVRGYEELLFC